MVLPLAKISLQIRLYIIRKEDIVKRFESSIKPLLNFDGDDYLYRYKCMLYKTCCVTRTTKQPLEKCEGRELKALISFIYVDITDRFAERNGKQRHGKPKRTS